MEQYEIEYAKHQGLRIWDVTWLGPFLIYTGAKRSDLSKITKNLLISSGIFIIIFNGRNYLMNRKLKSDGKLKIIPNKILQEIEILK